MAEGPPGANVQLEHGYIRLANRLATAIAMAPWDGAAQPRMVMALVRLTYGRNRKDAEIGKADWRAVTGLTDRHIVSVRKRLQDEGVMELVADFDARTQTPQRWRLRKDFTRWGSFAVPLAVVEAAEKVAAPPAAKRSPGAPQTTGDQVNHRPPDPVVPSSPGQYPAGSPGTSRKPNGHKDSEGAKDRKDRKDSTTPPSTARAGTRGLDRLRDYLGDHAEAADRMDESTDHGPTWAAGLMGLYGPNGTDPKAYDGLPEPERPTALAIAMDRYAAEAKPYNGRLFRRFLETVSHERQGNGNGSGHGGGTPGKGGSQASGAAGDYDHLGG